MDNFIEGHTYLRILRSKARLQEDANDVRYLQIIITAFNKSN